MSLRKSAIILLSCVVFMVVSSCGNSTQLESVPSPTLAPVDEAIEVDYVEILRNSQNYSNKKVRVAGQISDFHPTSGYLLYFYDRTGFSEDSLGFEVDLGDTLKYDESAEDSYSKGDYIVVEGTWNSGSNPGLRDANVLETGSNAQKIVDTYMDQWNTQRKLLESPVINFMDIVDNPDQYDGTYVRVAGRISATGNNVAHGSKYFSFRDPKTNYTTFSVLLMGCPPEMQELCVDDEYVLISGRVDKSSSWPKLVDCYVESVGENAEAIAIQQASEWHNAYLQTRDEHISTCSEYAYDDLARYPNDYLNQGIKVSGSVLQVDVVYGVNMVLVDVGNGNIIYVDYVGKQVSDPEILEDDTITFYGTFLGQKTYLTVLGTNKTVPFVSATYSSINQ